MAPLPTDCPPTPVQRRPGPLAGVPVTVQLQQVKRLLDAQLAEAADARGRGGAGAEVVFKPLRRGGRRPSALASSTSLSP